MIFELARKQLGLLLSLPRCGIGTVSSEAKVTGRSILAALTRNFAPGDQDPLMCK
jgi:hypothetical protein